MIGYYICLFVIFVSLLVMFYAYQRGSSVSFDEGPEYLAMLVLSIITSSVSALTLVIIYALS